MLPFYGTTWLPVAGKIFTLWSNYTCWKSRKSKINFLQFSTCALLTQHILRHFFWLARIYKIFCLRMTGTNFFSKTQFRLLKKVEKLKFNFFNLPLMLCCKFTAYLIPYFQRNKNIADLLQMEPGNLYQKGFGRKNGQILTILCLLGVTHIDTAVLEKINNTPPRYSTFVFSWQRVRLKKYYKGLWA